MRGSLQAGRSGQGSPAPGTIVLCTRGVQRLFGVERDRWHVLADQLARPPRPGVAPLPRSGEAVAVETRAHERGGRVGERVAPQQPQGCAVALEQLDGEGDEPALGVRG